MPFALETREVAVMTDAANEWRVEKYAQLGFAGYDAAALADTIDDDGFPIYWGDVARLLEAGCSREAALAIVL